MHLKVLSVEWQPFCLRLSVLRIQLLPQPSTIASALENPAALSMQLQNFLYAGWTIIHALYKIHNFIQDSTSLTQNL